MEWSNDHDHWTQLIAHATHYVSINAGRSPVVSPDASVICTARITDNFMTERLKDATSHWSVAYHFLDSAETRRILESSDRRRSALRIPINPRRCTSAIRIMRRIIIWNAEGYPSPRAIAILLDCAHWAKCETIRDHSMILFFPVIFSVSLFCIRDTEI